MVPVCIFLDRDKSIDMINAMQQYQGSRWTALLVLATQIYHHRPLSLPAFHHIILLIIMFIIMFAANIITITMFADIQTKIRI